MTLAKTLVISSSTIIPPDELLKLHLELGILASEVRVSYIEKHEISR